MGGHGGLNILPQKRWNVYNFDNREKVKQDEEAAAKEEQLKREQSRKRDAEIRLHKLKILRGIHSSDPSTIPSSSSSSTSPPKSDSNHINLFNGLKNYHSLEKVNEEEADEGPTRKKFKKEFRRELKPQPEKVVTEEDEKYRLGYGIAGKGVKTPWYMSKPVENYNDSKGERTRYSESSEEEKKKSGKKSVEELREERLKREKLEKERALALVREKSRQRSVPCFKDNTRSSRYHA